MFDTSPFLSIGLHCLSQSQRVMRYVLIWFMRFFGASLSPFCLCNIYTQTATWQYPHFVLILPRPRCKLEFRHFLILSSICYAFFFLFHIRLLFFLSNIACLFCFVYVSSFQCSFNHFTHFLHIPYRHFSLSWCVTCWMKGILVFGMETGIKRPSSMERGSVLLAMPKLRLSSFPMSCSRASTSTGLLPTTRWWERMGVGWMCYLPEYLKMCSCGRLEICREWSLK